MRALIIGLGIALSSATAFAQAPAYVFQTLAGGLTSRDGIGSYARFYKPHDVAVDADGTVYIADTSNHTIRKITAGGVVTTLAGLAGVPGDADGTGSAARFIFPFGVAVDSAGTVFVTEGGGITPDLRWNCSIRKITPSGVVSTLVSGCGTVGFPMDVAIDAIGTLYAIDGSHSVVRRVTATGEVSILAGEQFGGPGSTDGTGSAARFKYPIGIAMDAAGIIYVADTDNHTIRKVTAAGVVTTFAGLAGVAGSVDGAGAAARFNRPQRLAVGIDGTVYVADGGNRTIRAITPEGIVSTLAGTAGVQGTVDGVGAAASFGFPEGVAVDGSGALVVADTTNRTIRTVSLTGSVQTLAGSSSPVSNSAGMFSASAGVAVNAYGTIFASDAGFSVIYQIPPGGYSGPPFFPLAGSAGATGSTDGQGYYARFNAPRGLAADTSNLYVADTSNHTIRKIDVSFAGFSEAIVSTLAGSAGNAGATDGAGGAARFNAPRGIAIDAAGALVVADTGNHTIRAISPGGVVTTVAGSAGVSGSADGVGVAARFNAPTGVAVDAAGTIYVADTGNHAIRTIARNGTTSTIAGTAGSSGSVDATGSAARFSAPEGISVDAAGTVYVADTGNHTIRAIAPGGIVSTIGGAAAVPGDADGVGTVARFASPAALAADPGGSVYVADTSNGTIRLGVAGTASAPVVTSQPAAQMVRSGQNASFAVTATGTPSPTYRWQIGGGTSWSTLPNGFWCGASMSGVSTPILTIQNTNSCIAGNGLRCVITNSAGSTTSDAALLTVYSLSASPSPVNFGGTVTTSGSLVNSSQAQVVTVSYPGPETAQWTATVDKPWVRISNGSGSGTGQFTVAVSEPTLTALQLNNLRAGFSESVFATITVTAANLGLSKTVQLQLGLWLEGRSPAPFGVFDTPVNNATGLQGSFAVTGWVLDDVGIDRVEIWRDPVAGETTTPYAGPGPGTGKIFIANGLFVNGSRPDVEAVYRGSPFASRAGWGYLLLSWGLWDQGNGTYTLYAFAYDIEGHSTTLGTKTIGVDNAHATKPFGAIDTPSYGGTVSGTIMNFGWALTPTATPTCTIANGSVQMNIDSGPFVTVNYGALRTDIATSFPGFSNGTDAGGSYSIDTTTLTDGMHQIGWIVYDNCGRGDGIGSRFFSVVNGSRPAEPPRTAAAGALTGDATARRAPATSAAVVDVTLEPVEVRRGVDETTWVHPNSVGTRVVPIGQSERVEVQLPAPRGATYAGYQVVDGGRRALPLGSSLDAQAGIFYWQPAAGFLGRYDLEFTLGAGDRTAADAVVRVSVVVGPSMRTMIDMPEADAVREGPFTLAGWTLDLAATEGTGIDTVHVWAYPAAGGHPLFLGVAASGDARPDVAATYGAQFERAAYSLTVDRLAPGTYDIVVYPHRAATGIFDGAQMVRVHVQKPD